MVKQKQLQPVDSSDFPKAVNKVITEHRNTRRLREALKLMPKVTCPACKKLRDPTVTTTKAGQHSWESGC